MREMNTAAREYAPSKLTQEDDHGNRFDFSDPEFVTGFNFIARVRRQNGLFRQ